MTRPAMAEHFADMSRTPTSVPQVEVALVQYESEMLNVPTRDLSALLSSQSEAHNWRWNLFTEHSFDEALARADRFDCLILGYNAIHRSRALREALEASFPDTGVLVLHQMNVAAYDCLRDDLALTASPLEGDGFDVRLPQRVDGHLDVVLNWPAAMGATVDGTWRLQAPSTAWEAIHGLDVPSEGAWRVVLEADMGGRRRPVLVRTSALRTPRLAICSLLAEPGREQHSNLLVNLISFCARGLPEAVAFPEDAGPWELLTNKLDLAGMHAVRIADRAPDYARWPELGAGIVVTTADNVGEGADDWQGKGGRLVTLHDGRLLAREGSSDLRWIARNWAAEMGARPVADWLGGYVLGERRRGSILTTRAVLRTIRLLDDPATAAGAAEGMGLPRLGDEQLAAAVRELLEERRIRLGHIDHTVSTTVAALDLDRILDEPALSDGVRTRVRQWLAGRFPHVPVEDQLDIARALPGEGEFLRTALESLRASPVSPVVLTKAWEAAAACRVELDSDVVKEIVGIDELRQSVLVASTFLWAFAGYRRHWPIARSGDLDLAIEEARRTLRRDGSLLSGRRRARRDVESLSAEAAALLTIYAHPAGVLEPDRAPDAEPDTRPSLDAQVVRGREPLAPVLTEGLLAETTRLRIRNAELERDGRRLVLARTYCAGVAVLGTLLGLIGILPALKGVGDWLTAATIGIVILLTAFAVLGRWELLPAWARAVAGFVSEGVGGLPKRLRELGERL